MNAKAYPAGSNYLKPEALAVQKALVDLESDVLDLRRQFKEWIEWPLDVELDDDLMVCLLRCHRRVSDVAIAMSRRER